MLKAATLEERIKRIICTREIELDGEAYKGKYKLNDLNTIKSFILDKLRLDDKRKNRVYVNLSTGNKITISHDSAGKLAIQYKDGEIYQKSLVHIPQIINNMQFLEEMPADGTNAKYSKYSYYITGVNLDGESHTILSIVGHSENGIYYDQNVFRGTPEEVFAKSKNLIENQKYKRLNKILRNTKESDWSLNMVNPKGTPTASIDKYSKNSSDVQGV